MTALPTARSVTRAVPSLLSATAATVSLLLLHTTLLSVALSGPTAAVRVTGPFTSRSKTSMDARSRVRLATGVAATVT